MIHNDIYIYLFIIIITIYYYYRYVCVCVFGSYEHSYGIYDGQMSCYLLVWKGLH